MLQNARVKAFIVSELLRENQQGGITFPRLELSVIIPYATGESGVIQNARSCVQKDACQDSCVCTHLHYLFSCSDSIFFLWGLVLFVKI